MKNSLGNPARGEAFYPRNKEIKKIYKVLNSGTSIYLSAPRRVGKTSILKYIEEFPEDHYYFIYVITESIETHNDFFKVIFEELVKSEAIKKLAKVSTVIKDAISSILGRVKHVYNVEIREAGETDYYEILVELFSNIKSEHGNVVLLIDEFPQTIQNILNKDGKQVAERFIQQNRELRHHKHVQDKVRFIYTGSLSLYPMVEKVTALTSVNDLRTVEVGPLSHDLAFHFITLLLENDKLKLNDDLLNYTLEKIGWLIPFHIQLIAQEILDVYESTGIEVSKQSIDKAFEEVVDARNKPQFEPYFARLNTLFKESEYGFVLDVLKYIAINDFMDGDLLNEKGVKFGVQSTRLVMDILEGDGYVFLFDKQYRYASPILKLWCQKHICR